LSYLPESDWENGIWPAIKELIPNTILTRMNWNDKLGVREGLGCLLVLAAGAKLYISMIFIILRNIIKVLI